MKSIIAIACLLAFATALSIKGGEKTIDFEFNPAGDSLFGMVMKGSIDPKNEENNKISTFLKLANTYIPVLESMNNKDNNLKWVYNNVFSLGPLGSVGFWGSFNLVVGWNVYVNSSTSATQGTYLDVAYVPFAWGWADANVTVNNYLALGMYNSTLYYTRSYVIVDLQIYQSGEVCFMGNAFFWPVQLVTNLSSSLVSCQDEVIQNIINQVPIALYCNASVPFNMTHLNISFTQNMT
jgi:hypothetical protein